MRIPDDVIESLDQNGIDVSSAWLRCDVDIYNELYGSPLVQPVSLEAATLNELRFLDAAGTLTIRMTDSANSLVLYSSYVEFVEDGTGGSDGQTVAVDDVTIDWNNASQLEVKDAGITADKLAPGAVTNAKFADAPASTLKGRARGAGSGPVSDLTGTSVRPIVGDGWAGGQALVSDAIAGPVESVTTATEIGYVHGVTSPIQTQLNSQSVHNNLSGLQGGVSGEYYHLTAAQATTVGALTGWATKAYTNGSTTDVAEGTNLYFTNTRADARITAQKGVASGLATLDVGGKVPLSQLPATTIVETFVVASQAAMLALTAQQGDVCVRTDLSKTYILKTDPASTLANWQELLSPVDGVQSVGLSATGPLSVSGSPVTSSGTLALSWSGSAANFVMADGSTVVATTYMAVSAYPDLVAIEALAGTSGLLRKTAANTWSLDTNTYLTGNQTITLSGPVTGSGTTAITTAIANGALSIAMTSGLQTALDSKWGGTVADYSIPCTLSGSLVASPLVYNYDSLYGYWAMYSSSPIAADDLSNKPAFHAKSSAATSVGFGFLTSNTAAASGSRHYSFGTTSNGVVGITQWSDDLLSAALIASFSASSAMISALGGSGNRLVQASSTGVMTASIVAPTAFVQTIFDDADATAVRTTIGAQALDADLTAISALTTTGFARRTAADTWSASGIVWADVSGLAGTTATSLCVGNDSRLSDARTPTAHVLDSATHTISGKTAGQALIATGATTFAFATISGDATLSGTGAVTLANTAVTAGTYGSSTQVGTITVDSKGRITGASNTAIAFPVTSVFGRTGAVVAASGDYTTTQVTEGTNLYFTGARVLGTDLAGYAVGSNTALAATDTILGAFGKVQGQLNAKLNSSSYTAADVLAKLLTVDGTGSDLSADSLRGNLKTMSLNSAATSTGTWKQIAVLSASGSSNFDVVYLDLVQHAWSPTNGNTRRAQMTFRNRDSFVAKFWTYGDWSGAGRVQAYQDAGGTTSIYLYIPGSFWVIEAQVLVERASFGNETVITTAPTGTLLWDSGTATADYTSMTTQNYPDLVAIEALAGTSGFLKKTAANTWALDTNTYLTGNQTITISGVVTGSGATTITTSIADAALSIAKTSGLQSALDARMSTASYPDLVAIEALAGTSGLLRKTAANTWSLDTNTYLTGNQTITLSGVVTGSGTTAITTSIADGALSIAKTSGLQTALDGKLGTGLAVLLAPAAYQSVATYALGVGGGFRATGYDVSGFTSNGPGVEVHYDSANTRARILGYNRTSAARIELAVDGSPINFYANGTLKGAFSSAGDFSLVNLTASRALVSDSSKNIVASAVTATELGYLSGLTSSVQTQLNGKVNTNPWNSQTIAIAAASSNYFNGSNTGDLCVRFGDSTKAVLLGVFDGASGTNNASLWYTKTGAGAGGTFAVTGSSTYAASLTVSDNIYFANPANGTYRGIQGTMGANDYWRVMGRADADNAGYLEIATADDGTEPIYVRQYSSGVFGTLARTATLLDAAGNTNFPGVVSTAYYNGVNANYVGNWNASGYFGFGGNGDSSQIVRVMVCNATGTFSSYAAFSCDLLYTNNNGNGTNVKIGDDCWLGDVNTANTIKISGVQNSGLGYLKFGSDTNVFGYNGTRLDYGGTLGAYTLTGNTLSVNYINAFSLTTTSSDVTITTAIVTDLSTASMKYPVNDITTSSTLGTYALYVVNSASDLTLTLPSPTAGRSIKVAVRNSGSNGHRMYPASGHVIYWSGMYSTSYNTFNAQPSGVSSGQACLLRPGLYEFVGVSSTEWVLTSTSKMYS